MNPCTSKRIPAGGAAAVACALAVAAISVPVGAFAQENESGIARESGFVQEMQAELRAGLTVGSHSRSAAGLDIAPALSFDVTVRRQMWPRIALFAGYSRTAFGCEEGYCADQDVSVTGNHAALGAEWGSGGPWVRLGLLLGAVDAGADGDPSSFGVGVLGAAGLRIGTGRMQFMPGLSYRWMSASATSESAGAVALALDLGLAFRIGGG